MAMQQDNIIVISAIGDSGNKTYGLSTKDGITLIPAIFEDIKLPIDGIAIFKENSKWGVCSIEGKILLKPQYDEILNWNSDYIVIGEIDNLTHYKYGVVDWSGNVIIPVKYAAIELSAYDVFICFDGAKHQFGEKHHIDILDYRGNPCKFITKENKIICEDNGGFRNEYFQKYNDWLIVNNKILLSSDLHTAEWVDDYQIDTIMFTQVGTIISRDAAGKYGLRDIKGHILLLQIYDEIVEMPSCLVVAYHNSLGLISKTGQSILPNDYTEIADIVIDEKNDREIDPYWLFSWNRSDGIVYHFSPEHPFSTETEEQIIVTSKVFIDNPKMNSSSPSRIRIKQCYQSPFEVLILKNSDGENVFNFKEGLLLDSPSDKVYPLTKEHFILKNGNLYSFYSKAVTAPFKYAHAIKYFGNGILFYCVDGLWGAWKFSEELYETFARFGEIIDINIPPKYLSLIPDIKSFDFFIAKDIHKSYSGTEHECFQLLAPSGACLIGANGNYTGPFKIFGKNILAQMGDKFGFVNFEDEVMIPFKYDEVKDNGNESSFDVRIGKNWGILYSSGLESHIKYGEPIQRKGENALGKYSIVTDVSTNLKGVVNTETGAEVVPCLYSFISLGNNYISVARGGNLDNNCIVGVRYAKWGCYTLDGHLIVPIEYGCIEIEGDFILAGYDGDFMEYGQEGFRNKFSGVYALYDKYGTMLIKGFSQYSIGDKILSFYFGGEWECNCDEYGYCDYEFIYTQGFWLPLNRDMSTVLPDKQGHPISVPQGTSIIIKKIWSPILKKNLCQCNFPSELMVSHDFYIANGWIIAQNETVAVEIKSGKRLKFPKLTAIRENMLYVINDNSKAGIISSENKILLPLEYKALTNPVGRYIIGIKETEGFTYSVFLFDIESECIPSSAIQLQADIKYDDISSGLRHHKYLMYLNGSDDKSLKSYAFENGTFWIADDYKSLFDSNAARKIDSHSSRCYWFSYDDMEPCYEGNDEDNTDYMKDSWDAMTDGMHGDMPDGFDGDYDFLGR